MWVHMQSTILRIPFQDLVSGSQVPELSSRTFRVLAMKAAGRIGCLGWPCQEVGIIGFAVLPQVLDS